MAAVLAAGAVTDAWAQPRPDPIAPNPAQPMPVLPPTPPAVQPLPAQPPGDSPAPVAPARPQPEKPGDRDVVAKPVDAAPPPPPPPGAELRGTEPPPPLPPLPALGETDDEAAGGPPLAGWHGFFYLRDPKSRIFLFPRGRLHLDFNGFAGPGVGSVKAADGGNALAPRLFVRRLRLELAGEMFRHVSFTMGADLANSALTNGNGKAETAAGAAGQDPTADSARFAPVQAVPSTVALADAWVNYSVCPCLNFMLGQYQAPFSMENRTSNNWHTWMERNVAIRGFAFPNSKEIGLTVWGELGKDKTLGYQIGLFSGDGQNRPQVDNRADFMGRVWARPLSRGKGPLDKLQVGVSAHHGDRDPGYVGYDYPAVTTGSGFALWSPTYRDSLGRVVHVIPSGPQNEIGGELRVPFKRFELRGEAYYVANDTRESVDGFALTNTERLGQMRGWGWYVQASVWPFGDAFVNGDPGSAPSVTRIDFKKQPESPRGLEVFGILAVVDATYEGGSRSDPLPDAKTPGRPGVGSDINVVSYGLGATYWYGKNMRTSFNWLAYQTPGSASADNLALVPGNLGKTPDTSAHVLHELGVRVAVMF